ncbi:MAG: DUF4065 domain-containing protein [Candidatus Portiera sp.]|nr:DUF4065 domain-containing protein [Portiera sp.]
MTIEDKGKYHPFWLANQLLYAANQEGIKLTNLHLQKLLYFLHGHSLAENGNVLSEDKFQPWLYGPVIENVYHCTKVYGSGPITDYCKQFHAARKIFAAFIVPDEDTEFHQIFPRVWNKYKNEEAFNLVDLSHADNGAWKKARDNNQLFISNESIKQEFSSIPLD